jgi:hypothetical protein
VILLHKVICAALPQPPTDTQTRYLVVQWLLEAVPRYDPTFPTALPHGDIVSLDLHGNPLMSLAHAAASQPPFHVPHVASWHQLPKPPAARWRLVVGPMLR